MLATLTPQLKTATGEREGLSGLPPLPYRLMFTRYAHGEMKFSIYPEPRPVGVALMSQPEDLGYLTKGPWSREHREQTKYVEHIRLLRRSLVQRSEFQDDREEIPGYGGLPRRKIFRAHGRTRIRENGAIAWRKFGRSGIFQTGTIPGTGDLIAETAARYSGYMMAAMKQWCRDAFTEDYSFFAVWEPQERGMLHVHVCICSNETAVLQEMIDKWHERWNKLLIKVSEESRVDLFRKNKWWSWQENLAATKHEAEWLRKNPAQYLTKYLTKGGRDACSIAKFHPSQWWSVDWKTSREAIGERVRVLLGGLPLAEAYRVCNEWFAALGESLGEVMERAFPFTNPQFPECGGVVLQAGGEVSADLARWFSLFVDDFCTG